MMYAIRNGRNYAEEMTPRLAERADADGWISQVRAQDLINELEASDPDLLYGWMRTLAIPVIAKLIAAGGE